MVDKDPAFRLGYRCKCTGHECVLVESNCATSGSPTLEEAEAGMRDFYMHSAPLSMEIVKMVATIDETTNEILSTGLIFKAELPVTPAIKAPKRCEELKVNALQN